MNDIYKAPQASLDNASQTCDYNFQLFKISGIGLATLFGSILAGGYLMAANQKRLGQWQQARKTMMFSVIALIVILFVSLLIPENVYLSNHIFTIVQVIVAVQLSRKWFEKPINDHVANGGALASNWKAWGISLLFLLAIGVVIFVVAFMMMGGFASMQAT